MGLRQVGALSFFGFFSVVAIMYVLFADFLPSVFGSYAEQRLLLCVVLFFVIISGVIFFASSVRSISELYACLPGLLLGASFFLLPLPLGVSFIELSEIGLFGFFFLSIVFAGRYFFISGSVELLVRFFLFAIVVGCLFYGLMTLNVYMFLLIDNEPRLDKYIPWGFVNIRYWGHIATWVLPLLPVAALYLPLRDSRLWRFGVLLAGALWWWIVLLSASRGSMVSLLVGALFVLIFVGRSAMPWFRGIATHFFLGCLVWLFLSYLLPLLITEAPEFRGVSTTTSGRLALFSEAFAMSIDNFPLGMGVQSWLTHEILTPDYLESKRLGHPHNMYLMWAAEYGWALVFLLVAFVLQGFYYFRLKIKMINVDVDHAVALSAFAASSVAALLHAGLSAVFLAPASMLIGFFVLSLFWGMIQPERVRSSYGKCRPGGRFSIRVVLASTVIVTIVVSSIWIVSVWYYHEAMVKDFEEMTNNVPVETFPRFWLHGNFPRKD